MAEEKKEEQKEEKVEEVKVEKAKEVKPEEPKKEVKREPKPEPKPEPSGKFKDLIKQIEDLSVLELADLVKELETRFGVSAAMPMAAMPAAGGQADGGDADEEEKTEFTIVLKSAGEQKINVIKAVKEISGLGLKDAKDLVDAAPKEVKVNIKKEEADEIKNKLEAVGAEIELK